MCCKIFWMTWNTFRFFLFCIENIVYKNSSTNKILTGSSAGKKTNILDLYAHFQKIHWSTPCCHFTFVSCVRLFFPPLYCITVTELQSKILFWKSSLYVVVFIAKTVFCMLTKSHSKKKKHNYTTIHFHNTRKNIITFQ